LTRILTQLRLLRASLRTRGVRGTLGRAWRIVSQRSELRRKTRADWAYDRQHGVDTASWVRVPDLDTSSTNVEHAVRYEPSSVSEFELLMAKLRVDHSDFTFVDYGSGKGRVLMLAADYPFKRIVGVEFAKSLHEISRANIATFGDGAGRIETIHADATEFDPPAEPLVLYFFHPFGVPALEKVLSRVHESLEREPRPAYVVLTGPPDFAQAVEASGFRPVDVDELGWMTRGVFVASRNGGPA
jgi:hypothetical protein